MFVGFSRSGQRNGARRADEELSSKLILQRRHGAAYRSGRAAKAPTRGDKAALRRTLPNYRAGPQSYPDFRIKEYRIFYIITNTAIP
jgi:hypothetical protein